MLQDEQGTRVVYDDAYSNQGPKINELDETVWTRFDFCESPWRGTPMYRKPGGEIVELTAGVDQSQSPHINNRSQIVWGADPGGVVLWEKGEPELITDWGHAAAINDGRSVSIDRWHEDIREWQVWLSIEGAMLQIPLQGSHATGRLNNFGEVAWEQGRSRYEVWLMSWSTSNADITGDATFDLADWVVQEGCLGGPSRRANGCACHRADLDHSGTVDLKDFAHLQGAMGDSP
jgi:hypothetical protein